MKFAKIKSHINIVLDITFPFGLLNLGFRTELGNILSAAWVSSTGSLALASAIPKQNRKNSKLMHAKYFKSCIMTKLINKYVCICFEIGAI